MVVQFGSLGAIREAAKMFFKAFFSLKMSETKDSPPNFWTTRGIFFVKYCNKPVNKQLLPTVCA